MKLTLQITLMQAKAKLLTSSYMWLPLLRNMSAHQSHMETYGQVQWLMPAIPDSQEAEIRRVAI
jgi:hypothetical protein